MHNREHKGTQRLFAVPANGDLFPLEVWEEKEDIRSMIESVFSLPQMDRMHTDISDVVTGLGFYFTRRASLPNGQAKQLQN